MQSALTFVSRTYIGVSNQLLTYQNPYLKIGLKVSETLFDLAPSVSNRFLCRLNAIFVRFTRIFPKSGESKKYIYEIVCNLHVFGVKHCQSRDYIM